MAAKGSQPLSVNSIEFTQQSLVFGQARALTIKRRVVSVMVVLEALEGFAGGPAVKCEIASGMVKITDEFGAKVVRTEAEELGPVAGGAVDFFESGNGILLDVEFPDGKVAHRSPAGHLFYGQFTHSLSQRTRKKGVAPGHLWKHGGHESQPHTDIGYNPPSA